MTWCHRASTGTVFYTNSMDGKRYEIIDGELYMAPAPFLPHQWILMNLAAILHGHVRAYQSRVRSWNSRIP